MPRRIIKKVNGKLLAGVLIGAVAALFGGIVYAYSLNAARISRTQTALKALCLQRDDLDSRIKSEARRLARDRQFLRSNPHGTTGIPEALIRAALADDADTLANSMKTRRNLSILDC